MKITNKGKEIVTICNPKKPDVCIDVEPKQVVEFPDDEAKEILSANPSLEEVKVTKKVKK